MTAKIPVTWMPSSNLARFHAVRDDARVYRVKPLQRHLPKWSAVRAVCGRELPAAGAAKVIGDVQKCLHCTWWVDRYGSADE